MVSGRKAKAQRRRRGPLAEDPDPIIRLLLPMPAETVPLWAQLFVIHQSLYGAPLGSCVTTCQILAGALTHLGFACEPMAAAVQVSAVHPETPPFVSRARSEKQYVKPGVVVNVEVLSAVADSHGVYALKTPVL